MAILDSVRNIASANINRHVTNSISSGFTKVAGNLMGVNATASRSSSPATRRDIGKYSTQHLEYPIGVEGDPQQGHYIIFEIMERKKEKLKAIAAEATKARQRQIAIKEGVLEGLNFAGQFAPLTAADKKQKQVLEDHQKATKNSKGNYFIDIVNRSTTRFFVL